MGTQKWFKQDTGLFTDYNRADLAEPKNAGGYTDSSAYVSVNNPVVRTANRNYATDRAFAESDEHGAQTLFDHTDSTTPARVVNLFVDKSKGFRDLPAILGSAQMDAYQKFGPVRGRLQASSDLSPYSSRIVEHAKRAGALDSDTSTDVTNSYDMDDSKTGVMNQFDRSYSTMMSSAELAQGRGMYRHVMGRDRPNQTPTPMNQLSLDL